MDLSFIIFLHNWEILNLFSSISAMWFKKLCKECFGAPTTLIYFFGSWFMRNFKMLNEFSWKRSVGNEFLYFSLIFKCLKSVRGRNGINLIAKLMENELSSYIWGFYPSSPRRLNNVSVFSLLCSLFLLFLFMPRKSLILWYRLSDLIPSDFGWFFFRPSAVTSTNSTILSHDDDC